MSEEQKKKTLGIAIGSMVCGLFFLIPLLGFLLSLIAVILGIIALVQVSKNKDTLKGNGFAVTGIVLGSMGILVVPIMFILASIALPKFISLRQEAQEAKCVSDAAAIRTAIAGYYAAQAMKNDDEPHFPQSIHDSELLPFFKEGELPSHPFGRDWDDYYDSQKGVLNGQDACSAGEEIQR